MTDINFFYIKNTHHFYRYTGLVSGLTRQSYFDKSVSVKLFYASSRVTHSHLRETGPILVEKLKSLIKLLPVKT